MYLRSYQAQDCKYLAALFYDTVHCVNAGDYSEAQLNAWASGTVDFDRWDASLSAHCSVVAVENERIVGFGDMDATGYLDRLFVHKDYQRQGIATAICDRLERSVSAPKFSTYASITAKPFFEKRGYHVTKTQQVQRNGVLLTNYVMEKEN